MGIGIYKIRNLINNKIYIGKHEGREDDTYIGSGELFQRAVRKYGKKNFKREILRRCETLHELRIWEHVYIKLLHAQDPEKGYNIADGDVNTTEYNPAKRPEVRKKISEYHKGKKLSEETKKKMSVSSPHRKWTEEDKEKLRKKMVGRKFTEEHKQKLREAKLGKKGELSNSWGRKWSEEDRRRLSISHLGQISAMKGKHHTEESRIKMSKSQKERFKTGVHPMKGKHQTEEAKEKNRIAHLKKIVTI